MDSTRKPKTNGDSAARDNTSVGLVTYILASHGRVIPDIKANDSWPNTDGIVNVNDKDRTLIGVFGVQVKTLPKNHKGKLSCPVDLFVYVKETGNPIMLLVADKETERVYWQYYDQDAVEKISYKSDQKTKDIELGEQYFDKQKTDYIGEWEKILKDGKTQADRMRTAMTDLTDTEIGHSKDLIEKYRYSEALDYVESLIVKRWDTASDNVKYRLLTNKASALQKLEKLDEASVLYHEAFILEPNNPSAQTNEALALIIDGKNSEALEILTKLLNSNPLDVKAAVITIHTMHEMGKDYGTITSSFDASILDSPEVLHALASTLEDETQNDQMIELLERALSLDKTNIYIQTDLAIAMLYKIQQLKENKVSPELTGDQKILATRASELLRSAWSKIQDPRDQKSKANTLFNLSVAYRMLNDECLADNAIAELLKLDPSNSHYLRHAAGNAIERGKYQEAEALLSKVAFDSEDANELKLMLIDTLLVQEKTVEALDYTKLFLGQYEKRDDLFLHANDNLFKAFIDLGQLDDAQALADGLAKSKDTKALSLVFMAKLAQLQQKVEDALKLLAKAEKAVNEKTDRKTIYDIAEIAYGIKAYDIAARSYERILDPTSDSEIMRRYLVSLYEAKKYQTAIKVVGSLKENNYVLRGVMQFEWLSYMALQDLSSARLSLADFIKNNPGDEEARISLALIDFRTQDNRRLSAYLRRDIQLSELDQQSLSQLAKLYQLKGKTQRVLDVAYEMIRRYPNNADAHSAYVTLILGLGNKKNPLIDTDEVGPNTALIYEGGHFIVEANYEPDLSKNEISLADAEKRGFLGKRKGDEIILSTNRLAGDKSVQLQNVQSKYVFALQESMKNYERLFVDETDLMSFNTGPDNNNFDPLFKQLDETYENATNAENLYKSGKLTIDLFAKSVGKNIIEVFHALRLSPDLGVRSTRGDDQESRDTQSVLADESVELVADITSLITLFELKLSVAELGIKKLLIMQSTKDLIVGVLGVFMTESNQEGATLYKRGDQYVRQEVTSKERKARVKNIQELLNWLDENAQVQPFTDEQLSSKVFNKAAQTQIEDILLESQLDTMKLAIGESRVLYADDLGLRGLAAEIFSVKSTSTSLLLTYLRNADKLSNRKFIDSIISLASANYYHIGISPIVIFEAAGKADWSQGEPVESVIRALCRPEVAAMSMAIVIMQFLELSVQQGQKEGAKHLLPSIITEAIKHHDRSEVLALIRAGIELAFKNSLQTKKELLHILEKWITDNS